MTDEFSETKIYPYEITYEVRYEAGMGMGEKRFKVKDLAIEYAKTVGGIVYRVQRVWP